LKLEGLPNISKLWIDFAGNLPPAKSFFPAGHDRQTLLVRAEKALPNNAQCDDLDRLFSVGGVNLRNSARAQENIRKLCRCKAVAILVNLPASLFGGPLSQILKCLTAIKLCRELENSGISAVPVCWINAEPGSGLFRWSLTILNSDSELCSLHLQQAGVDGFSLDQIRREQLEALLAQIGVLGRNSFNSEALEILKNAYLPADSIPSASARLLSVLMEEWGMVLLDSQAAAAAFISAEPLQLLGNKAAEISASLRKQENRLIRAGYSDPIKPLSERISHGYFPMLLTQGLLMPVAAIVVDDGELFDCTCTLPLFETLGLSQPVLWPRASATILDAGSRRTLQKYDLSLMELFSGEDDIARKLETSVSTEETLEKFEELRSDFKSGMAELTTLAPDEHDLGRMIGDADKKVAYQIEKLKNRFESASAMRKETIGRHIRRACNFLTPKGTLQERELAGIYFLLQYSPATLGQIYEKLDAFQFDHQLISMD
jgi:uncharacterized protein YllA (UPF0747 family)